MYSLFIVHIFSEQWRGDRLSEIGGLTGAPSRFEIRSRILQSRQQTSLNWQVLGKSMSALRKWNRFSSGCWYLFWLNHEPTHLSSIQWHTHLHSAECWQASGFVQITVSRHPRHRYEREHEPCPRLPPHEVRAGIRLSIAFLASNIALSQNIGTDSGIN